MTRREIITKAIDGQISWLTASDIIGITRDTCAGCGVRSSAGACRRQWTIALDGRGASE